MHRNRWPQNTSINFGSSVVAEPMGAWQAICASVTKATRKVRLLSDHMGLVYAINSNSHSLVRSYNDFIRSWKSTFPDLVIVAQHIAGVDNHIADALSRQL